MPLAALFQFLPLALQMAQQAPHLIGDIESFWQSMHGGSVPPHLDAALTAGLNALKTPPATA